MAGILKSTCCDSDECPDDPCSDCGQQSCSESNHCFQLVAQTAPTLPYFSASFGTPTSQADWRANMSGTVNGSPVYAIKRYSYSYMQTALNEVSSDRTCCCDQNWHEGAGWATTLAAGPHYATTRLKSSVRVYNNQETQYSGTNPSTGAAIVSYVGPWDAFPQVMTTGANNCGDSALVYNGTNQSGGWVYQPSYPNYMNGGILVVFS